MRHINKKQMLCLAMHHKNQSYKTASTAIAQTDHEAEE